MLTYMHATYPNEGWGQYLVGGAPNWSVITVAGHSQGAGHAGYMAKLHVLDRVAMFSGPGDAGNGAGCARAVDYACPNATPAAQPIWLHPPAGRTGAAGADRVQLEPDWPWSVFGASVSVDGSAAPYADRRQLTTNIAIPVSPLSPVHSPGAWRHGGRCRNAADGRSGEPLYLPVWHYMVFP